MKTTQNPPPPIAEEERLDETPIISHIVKKSIEEHSFSIDNTRTMKTTQKNNNNDAEEEEEEVSGEAAYGETTYLWSSVKVLSIIVGCASSFFLQSSSFLQ